MASMHKTQYVTETKKKEKMTSLKKSQIFIYLAEKTERRNMNKKYS